MTALLVIFCILIILSIIAIIIYEVKCDTGDFICTYWVDRLTVVVVVLTIVGIIGHFVIKSNIKNSTTRDINCAVNAEEHLQKAKEKNYTFQFYKNFANQYEIKNFDEVNTKEYSIEYDDLAMTAMVYKKFNEAEYIKETRKPLVKWFDIIYGVSIVLFACLIYKDINE